MTTHLAFYEFVHLDQPDALRDELEALCASLELVGTIIVAEEGINGMLAGPAEAGARLEQRLPQLVGEPDIDFKRTRCEETPFDRLVVKVKPEIVTMRIDGVDACSLTAEHLPCETFRDWLRGGEEMVVIDTRNDYEYALGTFRGAVNPKTEAFHEFPAYVEAHRAELDEAKVVMFCTGGIRCEKATSWMIDRGIDEVYQLDGGVLNYFAQISDAERDWTGELFVFDKRVAVDTSLEETGSTLCPECGAPVREGHEPVCGCAVRTIDH